MKILMIDSKIVNYVDNTSFEANIFGPEFEINYLSNLEKDSSTHDFSIYDGLIAYHSVKLDSIILDKLINCKAIVKATIGYEELDLDYATSKGIKCANLPGIGIKEVADHTLALLLTSQRKLFQFKETINSGNWSWKSSGDIFSCEQLTLGLIGYGNIARLVANRAKSFGYKILYYDPFLPINNNDNKMERVNSLSELLSLSNIVSLHLPLNKSNYHILNKETFCLMRKDTILINTSRGGLIDTNALLWALDEGIISQACLDVTEVEPFIPPELINKSNVILTPHAAFYSESSLSELRRLAAITLKHMLYNQSVDNQLNFKKELKC